jgi:hypothetical protein
MSFTLQNRATFFPIVRLVASKACTQSARTVTSGNRKDFADLAFLDVV